jgi:hypothetical protein
MALRLYDASGQYIWEDTDNLHGICKVWSADLESDGVDEIIVFHLDHGSVTLLVFGARSSQS